MRIKEQEKRLTLNEHDDDDDDEIMHYRVTWWCSLLGHCATSRKVAGPIPDGVT